MRTGPSAACDFWPGEYQKNYTYIDTDAADKVQAVFDGVRSGNSWNVQGDLIDELQFTAKSKNKTVMMGQTLKVKAGDMVSIKIKAHDPVDASFCPLNMGYPLPGPDRHLPAAWANRCWITST
ncbi:MAG: hypothetical protein U5R30_18120 [Deltaproteobacteria bacterium]|nr:hypothetical protein [Deltaproteobacteria bacterium]